MQSNSSIPMMSYLEPAASSKKALQLVAFPGTAEERRFTFYDSIEIARYNEGRTKPPGILFLLDPTVSSRHCIITQNENGICFIRDMSRNGTSVGGRRLVPNTEVEIRIGQSISVGKGHIFLLWGESAVAPEMNPPETAGFTMEQVSLITVTVLVGDIRNYTNLVQRSDSAEIQQAIGRMFNKLAARVSELGGTVKEYRGDAILAYWQENLFENQAVEACRAAISLDRFARELANDPSVWNIPDAPLEMDWALATGPVTIATIGGNRPTALSLVGAPVVLAFRIEKFADNQISPIVLCRETMEKALGYFEFRDLGEKDCKGFDAPVKVYALVARP